MERFNHADVDVNFDGEDVRSSLQADNIWDMRQNGQGAVDAFIYIKP